MVVATQQGLSPACPVVESMYVTVYKVVEIWRAGAAKGIIRI